ncbi:MAG: hypothetical protein KDK90_10955 [Leptospiraceae bacterium]|nr:hypothetical protein [Leptospiraceae bacterium]
MAAHNIILTDKGFKILTNNYKSDLISLCMLLAMLLIFTFLNLYLLPYILIFYFVCSIPYFYQKINKGYIYSVSYYYQLTITMLLVPPAFMKWQILVFVFLIFIPMYLKKDPLKQVRFSMGLFLSILFIAIGLILKKIGWVDINYLDNPMFSFSLNSYSKASVLLFSQFSFQGIGVSNALFSIFEHFGILLYIIPLTLIFTGDQFLKNISIFILILILLSINYHSEITTVFSKIANHACIWYIFYSAPGKNFYLNFKITIISLFFTCLSLFFFIAYFPNGISTYILINLFFVFYMISFRFHNENILDYFSSMKKLRS